MKTRTTRKLASASAAKGDATDNAGPSQPISSANPPLLFILPKDRSIESRIVTISNPATGDDSRYFYDPIHGIYEFTRISSPRKDPTCWLLAPDQAQEDGSPDAETTELSKGYTLEDSGLFVATAMDPIFLALPSLLSDARESGKQLYITLDDHLDKIAGHSETLRDMLVSASVLEKLEAGMTSVCDKVEAGDDSMFRLNMDKLYKMLLSKAEKVVAAGLPPSMQEKFVKDALQVPSTLRTQEQIIAELEKEEAEAGGVAEPSQEPSQSSASLSESQASLTSSVSVSTAATSVQEDTQPNPPESEVQRLMQLRTAFNFILSSYVKASFHGDLQASLSAPGSGVDFTPLDKRLAEIAAMKKEAHTLRSLSENISRKRVFDEDDEAVEARAEKKRKKEEEEAKKKAQSRAIKQLAKVNTSGMQKLSSFFTKPAAKKASG